MAPLQQAPANFLAVGPRGSGHWLNPPSCRGLNRGSPHQGLLPTSWCQRSSRLPRVEAPIVGGEVLVFFGGTFGEVLFGGYFLPVLSTGKKYLPRGTFGEVLL